MINGLHHIAIICKDIEKSIAFYTDVLGFEKMKSTYRQERKSWKVDLHHPANITLELFTFENAPERPSYPEAIGLRHLAFSVVNIEDVVQKIISKGIQVESIRTDLITGKRFTFFADPDDLPIELYEV